MKKKKNFPLGLRTWGDISIHTYIHICIHTHTCEMKVLVTQSCLTLCDFMDCSLPGSSVHRILHARILERVAISFSRGSSQRRDWTWVSHIVGRLFTDWATREYIVAYYGRYYGILWQPRLVKQPLSWSLCLNCPYLPWYLNYNALLLKDCEWLPFVF